ncbi:MAG: SpoIIE family protein phosphatase [Acidobacteriota bacterium]
MKKYGKILLVDNNKDIYPFISKFLENSNYDVIHSNNGKEGIEKFLLNNPGTVITNIDLDDMKGETFVKKIKKIEIGVQIIIISDLSDRNRVFKALKYGASDIIKIPVKENNLRYLLNKITSSVPGIDRLDLNPNIMWEKKSFRLSNDLNSISKIVDSVYLELGYLYSDQSFLKTALQEIIINAVEHGNLEVSYKEKQSQYKSGNYYEYLKKRSELKEFKKRYVSVKTFSSVDYMKIIVEDMGRGFDHSKIADPFKPSNFLKESGKGIMLAKKAFDDVQYNQKGNIVTLVKYSNRDKKKINTKFKDDITGEIDINDTILKFREKIDLELDLAADFQKSLFPHKDELEKITSLDIEYLYKPLFRVSGDFIDITKLDDGIYGFFIADISGHGISAALISSMLKVFFSLYARDILSTQLLFEILNHEFFRYLDSGEFFSSFYGIYFEKEKRFIFTNANHPPPLLLRKNKKVIETLSSEGFFVGIFKDPVFGEKEIRIEKGDRILFYTDGVIELKNRKKERYGTDRLKGLMVSEMKNNVRSLVKKIESDLYNFADTMDDDITIQVVEFK